MSRRNRKIDKREPVVDPKYADVTLGHFTSKLMWDGKKELARRIIYKAFDEIEKRSSQEDPLSVFKKALENCRPSLEVRSRRVGGATYQVPVDVRQARRTTLAMRWLILHSRSRKEKTMASRLAAELLDAYNNKGLSIKKKEDVHRMAEANRAFSHYNW